MGLLRSIAVTLVAALALAGCQSDNKRVVMTDGLRNPVKVETIESTGRVKTSQKTRSWFTKNGMADPFAGKGSPYFEGDGAMPKGGGKVHIGKPYKVGGRWFRPREDKNYNRVGIASWYGAEFHTRKTANGEYFNMNDLTAAHTTLPLPSYAKVTNLENGKSIVVRINDRGPFVGNRIIDLSKRSADVLGTHAKGKAKVRVQYIGPAPLNDQGKHLMAMNKKLASGVSMAELRGGTTAAPAKRAVAEAVPVKSPVRAARKVQSNQPIMVQVAVYRSREKAEIAMQQAGAVGNVSLIKGKIDGEEAYRVQMGPYANQKQALADLEEAQTMGFLNAKLLATDSSQVASR